MFIKIVTPSPPKKKHKQLIEISWPQKLCYIFHGPPLTLPGSYSHVLNEQSLVY